ncbi:TetR/AcrR family transcriptional regulator [Streptomyces sp. NPDC101776]|uniref:TetR/AcrR family transcriptional regulator n=1 Tax=Streptomyces sp. NPDC101776 TaxID=3366146 RepID=UPI003804D1F5
MKSPEARPESLGRRERRRREAHDALYAVAIDLFVSGGYEATKMEDIADRADVSRATVFNHFAQKAGILEEWGARRRARVVEILRQQHAEDLSVGERLRRYIDEMATLNIESRTETVVLMEASARCGQLLRDPAPERELARIIEDGARGGEVRPGIDPGEAGSLIAAGYFAGVLRWTTQEPPPFDLRTRLGGMLDIVLGGILV